MRVKSGARAGTQPFCLRWIFLTGGVLSSEEQVPRVEKYRQLATELRMLAGKMKDRGAHESLLHLAASYDSMAVNLGQIDEKLEPH
jgi:hypothetical protein